MNLKRLTFLILFLLTLVFQKSVAQCGGQIMEPGFAFLTSSRGCAPFNVGIETLYLAATPGTVYYVDWGDGTPEETYVQTNATGVTLTHVYPNSPVECGYDVIIDAENGCNPRGSVVPIETQVVVWTNDVLSIDPGVFRVCQGYAADVQFIDNSDWNCFPRPTRENGEPRWIQWIYGTGAAANRIPGINVNSVTPAAYPYQDPAPGMNPKYPIYAPGEVSLPINVPATAPADIGKEFQITLKNWNQCNPYDNDITDGNAFNPVSGDLVNGDNAPQTLTARVVIVDAPQPDFQTRLGNAAGPVQSTFCVEEDIYFEDLTPPIAGAGFNYTWEFYDNSTGTGTPVFTSNAVNPIYAYSTGGQKLIRLMVHDGNAAGNCEAIYEDLVFISPTLIANIGVSDLSDNPIAPLFCQSTASPVNFDVRFTDNSTGVPNPSTQWRWEFYDENDVLVREEPGAGAFSSTELGPFDEVFTNVGTYRVKLLIRDVGTSCVSEDEVEVIVYENPVANFSADRVCEGNATSFEDLSTLNPINGESIVSWEWDFDYDGVTFSKDAAYDNQTSFTRAYAASGTYEVALRVTTDQNSCSDIFTQTVTVDPLPLADITPDQTSGCSELLVNFTNNAVGSQPDVISQYIWEIDAGSGYVVDSIQNPADPSFTNIYAKSFANLTTTNKIYNVRLRSISVNGCETVSAPVAITVLPGPRSGFMSLNYSPFDDNCSPVNVDFEVDSETQSLNPVDYQWRIDDSNGLVYQENTGSTPAFNYQFVNDTQSVKNFYVTLNATLASGCSGDSTRIIRVNPVPSANFDIDTLEVNCDLMRIEFEAAQKGLTTYEWEIRENGAITFSSNAVGDRFEHVFNKVTADVNVEVRLRTTNFANCESDIEIQNFIVPQREDINVAFTATPLNQTLPSSTVFLSNTTNSGPWTYLWDFGNGDTSTDPALGQYEYGTYGTYTITLTASYGDCSESQAVVVTIDPIPPVVDFDYDPASGCAPLTVNFTNLTQYAEPGSYFWQFGVDQGTSNAINPSYTYYEPGIYTVSLSATNVLGDTITETKPLIIEVFESPNAQFEVRPSIVYIPDNPLYIKNNSFGATSFFWDFGDGNTSEDDEPVHYYEEEGEYDIMLIAINENGCRDTTRRESIVKTINGGRILIPNAFSPNLIGPIGGEAGGIAGTNDIFLPISEGVTEFEMLIFNRWGELLFQSNNKNLGWDGYYKGKLCPQDVYVYKLNLTFEDGTRTTKMGDVNLIR
ncbi:PKD domain-containing protein [Fulvivirga kasyanovii]|uniref:PKD domain-containing protein n=1 Tax=Fulvivirga kasyanovii TaxID=396812 RepID=A0ABW9RY91_9BACT|nr:PKD domain-containing protein [Fulvivirga kasyanovii]MTI28933.1 PKD domain-containing protein [Fulvivirga kasyanovii]